MSRSEQENSANLRGNEKALKMKSTDTIRIWWVPMLSQGKLHIEILPDSFPGETEEGAAIMVAKVRAALNIRFQGSTAPKTALLEWGPQAVGVHVVDGGKDKVLHEVQNDNIEAYEHERVQLGSFVIPARF